MIRDLFDLVNEYTNGLEYKYILNKMDNKYRIIKSYSKIFKLYKLFETNSILNKKLSIVKKLLQNLENPIQYLDITLCIRKYRLDLVELFLSTNIKCFCIVLNNDEKELLKDYENKGCEVISLDNYITYLRKKRSCIKLCGGLNCPECEIYSYGICDRYFEYLIKRKRNVEKHGYNYLQKLFKYMYEEEYLTGATNFINLNPFLFQLSKSTDKHTIVQLILSLNEPILNCSKYSTYILKIFKKYDISIEYIFKVLKNKSEYIDIIEHKYNIIIENFANIFINHSRFIEKFKELVIEIKKCYNFIFTYYIRSNCFDRITIQYPNHIEYLVKKGIIVLTNYFHEFPLNFNLGIVSILEEYIKYNSLNNIKILDFYHQYNDKAPTHQNLIRHMYKIGILN